MSYAVYDGVKQTGEELKREAQNYYENELKNNNERREKYLEFEADDEEDFIDEQESKIKWEYLRDYWIADENNDTKDLEFVDWREALGIKDLII